jgi:hypothetical protein
MAKPQAKTLQERMGFVDQDLKTPGHDAIMLWLDDYVKPCLQDWLGVHEWPLQERALQQSRAEDYQAYTQDTHVALQRAREAVERYQGEASYERTWRESAQRTVAQATTALAAPTVELALPAFPRLSVQRTRWEHPIVTGHSYTVGFVDMMVTYRHPVLSYNEYHRSSSWSPWDPAWRVQWRECQVFFEVKTAIPSLGELLRQLTLYQTHGVYREIYVTDRNESCHGDMRVPEIFVVCPDARFAEKIREQGFGFVQSPPAQASINGQAAREPWLFGR